MVTIPIEVWEGEQLEEGDIIEADIRKHKKIEKPKAQATA